MPYTALSDQTLKPVSSSGPLRECGVREQVLVEVIPRRDLRRIGHSYCRFASKLQSAFRK